MVEPLYREKQQVLPVSTMVEPLYCEEQQVLPVSTMVEPLYREEKQVLPVSTMVESLYCEEQQVLPVSTRVMSEVKPAIRSTEYENPVPDTQGEPVAEVENAGYGTGSDVTLRIVASDSGTFQMVEDSIFLPRFAAGDVAQLRVRIAVADDTGAGSYPAVLEGEYSDAEGIIRSPSAYRCHGERSSTSLQGISPSARTARRRSRPSFPRRATPLPTTPEPGSSAAT